MAGWKHDRHTRQERGYGSAWDKIREVALRRDKYLCQACLKQGKLTPLKMRPYDHAVDHIIPKAKGGTDDMDNLQSLCAPCHEAKTDAEAAEAQGRKQARRVGMDGYPID